MKFGSRQGTTCGVLLNSWFWITFIFFGQAFCSVIFSVVVKIPRGEIVLPILVLFLGGVCALLFLIFSNSATSLEWKWIVPALVYGTFIYLMSSRGFAGVETGFDTSYFHPVEYATLGLLLGRFWYSTIDEKGFIAFSLRVLAAGAVFGAADEIHQAFVPGRTADLKDLALDIAGIVISLLIIAAVRRIIRTLPSESLPG